MRRRRFKATVRKHKSTGQCDITIPVGVAHFLEEKEYKFEVFYEE